MKDYLSRYENKTKVSLNEEKRRLEIQSMRSQRLAIENRLRKAKGEELLNNLDELEEAEQANTDKKDKKKEADAFAIEAGAILNDMIRLKKQAIKPAQAA